MDIITEAFNQLLHGPAWLLVTVFIIAIGYVLKSVPPFPNKLIPLVCVVAGTILLPILADPAALTPGQRHPQLVFALMGFILGAVAWAFHGLILKRIEKKFGFFLPDDPPTDQPPPR